MRKTKKMRRVCPTDARERGVTKERRAVLAVQVHCIPSHEVCFFPRDIFVFITTLDKRGEGVMRTRSYKTAAEVANYI